MGPKNWAILRFWICRGPFSSPVISMLQNKLKLDCLLNSLTFVARRYQEGGSGLEGNKELNGRDLLKSFNDTAFGGSSAFISF